MGPPGPIQQNRLLLARLPYRHWLPYDPASRPLQEKRMPNPVSRRLTVVTAAIVIAAAIGPVAPSSAQSFPDRPIRFFVPFPAGGSTDAVARAMQPALEKILGQPVVVENRAGAGGMLGVDAIAKAAPDGYTIGLAGAGALGVNIGERVTRP